MTDTSALEDIIREQRRIALRMILGAKDQIRYLKPEDDERLRRSVLVEINRFAELAVSIVHAAVAGEQINDEAIELLRRSLDGRTIESRTRTKAL